MDARDHSRILVVRAQSGDRSAFDELAERYRPRIASVLRGRLGDHLRSRVDVEDLVQEVLLRAFAALGQFRWSAEESLFRWLSGIARNVILEVARREKREILLPSDCDLAASDVSAPRAFDRLLRELESYELFGGQLEREGPLAVLGDYSLSRQVGRGGMGVVYEAWQSSMDRRVALKVLPAGIAADPRAAARFLREAQTAGRLNHPNIVQVHGLGIEQNTPYYSMEYIEGETLAQVLARVKDSEPQTDTLFGKKDSAGYFEDLARRWTRSPGASFAGECRSPRWRSSAFSSS